MSLESVQAAVRFVETGPNSVSSSLQTTIRGWIDTLYQSATGSNLLEAAAGRDLLYFGSDPANGTSSGQPININEDQISHIVWFNSTGELVYGGGVLVLAHELKHTVSGLLDPNAANRPTDAQQNAADWIADGPAVIAQNRVARELGLDGQVRLAYFAAGADNDPVLFSGLQLNYSYTDGNIIDSVRLATAAAPNATGGANIDQSLRTTKVRDLLIGGAGNDRIYGGAGRDYIYGGLGNDLIHGGYNAAVLAGSAATDGVDTVGYLDIDSASRIQVWISDTPLSTDYQDDPDFGRAVFVSGLDGAGIDTLVSIEKITGTNNADQVTIDSLSAIRFADPATGQGGLREIDLLGNDAEDGDSVDLASCNEAANITINDNAMTISATADPARKLLISGAEAIIATGYDDTIKINTSQGFMVDGFGGADTITGSLESDVLNGGEGDDIIYGRDGDDVIDGGDGADTIYGGTGGDVIYGGIGEDRVIGGIGDDLIYGGDDNDRLSGSEGDDDLNGEGGVDRLFSGSGLNNALYGGDGNDFLIFNGGGGLAEGGTGNDVIDARNGLTSRVIYREGDGFDTVKATYALDFGTLTVFNVDQALENAPDPRNINQIDFSGLSINDYKLVWSPQLVDSQTDTSGNPIYLYQGKLRIVDKATGANGVDLGTVVGTSYYLEVHFSTLYTQFYDLPDLAFADGSFDNGSEGRNMELEISSGGLQQAALFASLVEDDANMAYAANPEYFPSIAAQAAQLVESISVFDINSSSDMLEHNIDWQGGNTSDFMPDRRCFASESAALTQFA